MFGMLSPARHSLDYRSAYARCCQHHRRVNGVSALPWLSYEAVLLYQAAADAGAVRAAGLPAVRCCKLRPLPLRPRDAEVGAFCAHVGSLLASIKVEDDLRDRGSLRARLLAWLYRRRFAATRRYFGRLDPGFARFVEGVIAEHLALERPGSAISLADYVAPTARAFGHVYALMARLPGLAERAGLLRQLGECVGAAIISFDCAVDRDRDRRRGDFNPLGDGPEPVQEALRFSRERLNRARVLCEEAFGPEARTVRTLEGVLERVTTIGRRLACPRCGAEVGRVMQSWGLAQRAGAVQLNSFLGLGGLAALAAGLAAKLLMSNVPGGVPPMPPLDPNAVTQPPPPAVVQPPPPAAVPPASSGTSSDCSSALSCCDGTQCCLEGTSCALDNACDGLDCSGCDGCGDCGSGCSGCDISC